CWFLVAREVAHPSLPVTGERAPAPDGERRHDVVEGETHPSQGDDVPPSDHTQVHVGWRIGGDVMKSRVFLRVLDELSLALAGEVPRMSGSQNDLVREERRLLAIERQDVSAVRFV